MNKRILKSDTEFNLKLKLNTLRCYRDSLRYSSFKETFDLGEGGL